MSCPVWRAFELWVSLDSSGQLWAALGSSGQVWASLASSGQLWVALGSPGQLWTGLGSSGQLWTALGRRLEEEEESLRELGRPLIDINAHGMRREPPWKRARPACGVGPHPGDGDRQMKNCHDIQMELDGSPEIEAG